MADLHSGNADDAAQIARLRERLARAPGRARPISKDEFHYWQSRLSPREGEPPRNPTLTSVVIQQVLPAISRRQARVAMQNSTAAYSVRPRRGGLVGASARAEAIPQYPELVALAEAVSRDNARRRAKSAGSDGRLDDAFHELCPGKTLDELRALGRPGHVSDPIDKDQLDAAIYTLVRGGVTRRAIADLLKWGTVRPVSSAIKRHDQKTKKLDRRATL